MVYGHISHELAFYINLFNSYCMHNRIIILLINLYSIIPFRGRKNLMAKQ